MWLRHVFGAKFVSRGCARSFSDYAALMKDWQGEIGRIARQGGFDFPEFLTETAPLIEEFLRSDLKQEAVKSRDNSGQPALRGWCMRANDALKRLHERELAARQRVEGQLGRVEHQIAARPGRAGGCRRGPD